MVQEGVKILTLAKNFPGVPPLVNFVNFDSVNTQGFKKTFCQHFPSSLTPRDNVVSRAHNSKNVEANFFSF